ncbi:hypothetical protein LNTAR_15402 [Lentisphaera araneosa HTCC2155]|uniref:Uncharacterized protein n=1 Tax=Lentisphaera araneosa HTCC2155 TaxID=313628 RepID=A6DU65_9BACT|nr:hypothetical protein LNTAR_15402 [Lentisphaera araneosa HTCC2155]
MRLELTTFCLEVYSRSTKTNPEKPLMAPIFKIFVVPFLRP